MDYVEVTHHDYMARCLVGPLDIGDLAVYHFQNNVLAEERGYHRRNEKTYIEDKITFTLGDDYIELSDSVIEEEPIVEVLPHIGGQSKTLSMTCKFRIANVKIIGKICILNSSNSRITSDYELLLKRIEILTTIGFIINGDSYTDDYFIHKFDKATVSLVYKDGSQTISLLDKLTDSKTKHLLENYILENCTKEIFVALQNVFLEPIYDKGCVSNSVGADYSLRNMFRLHEKKMKAAFIIFINKVLAITNGLIVEDSPSIKLTKIFATQESKDKKQVLKVCNGFVNNLNSLKRVKNPIILVENECVILYISADFENLQLKYEDGEETKEECLQTMDSYLKISIKRLKDPKKVDINFLEFKIKKFQSASEISLILDYQISSAIEEKIKDYFIKALKSEELNIFATNPPNVEIQYDSDDNMAENSDDE